MAVSNLKRPRDLIGLLERIADALEIIVGQDKVKRPARKALTTDTEVDDLLTNYIDEHHDLFTCFQKRQPAWTKTVQCEAVRGDCAEHYTLEVSAAIRLSAHIKDDGVCPVGVRGVWVKSVRGDCAGRYTQASNGSWTLSVPTARFSTYTRERGVDKQHLKRWTSEREVQTTASRIVAGGSTVKVYVIPINITFKESDQEIQKQILS